MKTKFITIAAAAAITLGAVLASVATQAATPIEIPKVADSNGRRSVSPVPLPRPNRRGVVPPPSVYRGVQPRPMPSNSSRRRFLRRR
jgi:hypothetical protein